MSVKIRSPSLCFLKKQTKQISKTEARKMCKEIHRNSELNNWANAIEITDELIECFDDFRKEKSNQEKWTRRHISDKSLSEAEIKKLIIHSEKTVEEIVFEDERKQHVHLALTTLTEKQRSRIMRYYFDEMTLNAIAQMDGVHFTKVHKSIRQAEKKIAKFILKNFR